MICDLLHLAATLISFAITFALLKGWWNWSIQQFNDKLDVAVSMATGGTCIAAIGIPAIAYVVSHWGKVLVKRFKR